MSRELRTKETTGFRESFGPKGERSEESVSCVIGRRVKENNERE